MAYPNTFFNNKNTIRDFNAYYFMIKPGERTTPCVYTVRTFPYRLTVVRILVQHCSSRSTAFVRRECVRGVARAIPIFQVLIHKIRPKALKPSSPQTLKPTSSQTHRPTRPQALKPSSSQPLKP